MSRWYSPGALTQAALWFVMPSLSLTLSGSSPPTSVTVTSDPERVRPVLGAWRGPELESLRPWAPTVGCEEMERWNELRGELASPM